MVKTLLALVPRCFFFLLPSFLLRLAKKNEDLVNLLSLKDTGDEGSEEEAAAILAVKREIVASLMTNEWLFFFSYSFPLAAAAAAFSLSLFLFSHDGPMDVFVTKEQIEKL